MVGPITVTGEPYIGYTLRCSEPTIEGGSGNAQISYFWVDANSKTSDDGGYQGNTAVAGEYDLGKVMYCIASVHDITTDETVQVESNHVGPINRPIVPDFDVWVNNTLHEDPSEQVGVLPNGSVICEVRAEPVTNPAVDMTYKWAIRSGTGRLNGDDDSPLIIYSAPDNAPAGALVICTVQSIHANDQVTAAEVTILVSEEDTEP